MPAIIEQHRNELEAICQKNGIVSLSLFGSFARGDETDESDLDFLVEFKDDSQLSLFDLGGIVHELTEVFHRKVDLVEKKALNKRIAPYIQDDITPIYQSHS